MPISRQSGAMALVNVEFPSSAFRQATVFDSQQWPPSDHQAIVVDIFAAGSAQPERAAAAGNR
jgi:hypothetical protein